MIPSFESAEAKVSRAHEHLKALDEYFARFFATHEYGIGGQFDADTKEITLYGTSIAGPFPLMEWGARVGDYIHNLRSALDHTVWQLARAHLGREPTDDEARRIQFPIEDTKKRFKSARVRPFLSETHFGMLDQYQPYKAGDSAPHHKLAILRDLSNTDKHRVVHAAAVMPEGIEMEFTNTSGVVGYDELVLYFGQPLKEGVPIGHIRGVVADRPDPKMEAQGPIQLRVVFDDPANPVIHEAPLIHVLSTVGEFTDGVVGWIAHHA